jgi:hypothetical protein
MKRLGESWKCFNKSYPLSSSMSESPLVSFEGAGKILGGPASQYHPSTKGDWKCQTGGDVANKIFASRSTSCAFYRT